MAAKSYDYIIVGAGSAGCTLARRLTEDTSTRVLLLEAGGWDRDPWIKIPIGWGRILEKRLHDWMYFTEPEAALNGRRIECARGKVIGGSSSINAMAYVRGNKGDYDRWARSGLAGWSYEEVLPYFRRQESWESGGGEYRGGDGPLTVGTTTFEDPLIEACLAAGAALQMPRTPDYNGAQQEGLGRMQQTIRNGRRCSAAEAYLRPALGRANLTIETGAPANRIVLESGRAVGIEYARGGEMCVVRAEREVILCGGVINSPQLLMLSGIGDPDRLTEHGIRVARALPGVGKNLQDHLSVLADYARTDAGPFVATLRLDRVIDGALARAYCFGTGPAAETPSGWIGFITTSARSATGSSWFAAWRRPRRYRALSRANSSPEPMWRAMTRSTPISAPPRRPRTTRSAPARWDRNATIWRWSIPSCECAGSRAARGRRFGDARHGRRQYQRAGDHDRREKPPTSSAGARRCRQQHFVSQIR